MNVQQYIGRFAPSPTGWLHSGSLIAALASFLDARAHGGRWLVRIEDLDRNRQVPGAERAILQDLERHGLLWDGPVTRQSERSSLHAEALRHLITHGHAYPCACSRQAVRKAATRSGPEGPIYPGTCARGLAPGRTPRSWRVRTAGPETSVHDRVQPPLVQQLDQEVGDFVVFRADGFCAYQLAVVVDDAEQGVTHVVRGCDLIDSSPRQRHLQRLLEYPEPAYLHVPVAVDHRGMKLSKSAGAASLDAGNPTRNLCHALVHLGQPLPAQAHAKSPQRLLASAIEHWDPERIAVRRTLPWGLCGHSNAADPAADF